MSPGSENARRISRFNGTDGSTLLRAAAASATTGRRISRRKSTSPRPPKTRSTRSNPSLCQAPTRSFPCSAITRSASQQHLQASSASSSRTPGFTRSSVPGWRSCANASTSKRRSRCFRPGHLRLPSPRRLKRSCGLPRARTSPRGSRFTSLTARSFAATCARRGPQTASPRSRGTAAPVSTSRRRQRCVRRFTS